MRRRAAKSEIAVDDVGDQISNARLRDTTARDEREVAGARGVVALLKHRAEDCAKQVICGEADRRKFGRKVGRGIHRHGAGGRFRNGRLLTNRIEEWREKFQCFIHQIAKLFTVQLKVKARGLRIRISIHSELVIHDEGPSLVK